MSADDSQSTRDSASLVSVIMAVHGGADCGFLRSAMASVLAQTWPTLELIIVFDGTVPEAIEEAVAEFEGRDGRVDRVVLRDNAGPGAARNAGISRARGEYVAILDADDLAEPERLERQIAFLCNNRADLVGCDYTLINERGEQVGVKRLPVDTESIRRHVLYYNPIGNSTVLARREIFVNHPYREDLRYGEDYAQWVHLLRCGYRLLNLPEALVRFRVPSRFIARRRGWLPFRTDLQNKSAAVVLYPLWQRPFLYPVAVVVAATRLLPAVVLAPIYAVGRWLTR